MDSYKISAIVLKSKSNKCETAIHSGHRNRQSPTKDTKHAIPVLVNGLTLVNVNKKNASYKLESSAQQNNEHKIVIIGDSQA